MATVLKHQHSLSSAFHKRAGGGLLCIALGSLILVVATRFVLVGGFLIVVGTVLIKDGYKFHRGAVGESRVAAVLARLPDGWFIFHNMVVGLTSAPVALSAPEPQPGP